MQFTSGQKTLLLYWGTIQEAVSRRAGTAELWEAVRNVATREGVELSGVSASDMSSLRGISARQRNSMDSFQRAGPNDAITGPMIGSDVSARDAMAQSLAPSYIVRFEHDVTVNGELLTFWRSSVIDGRLPTTKAELLRSVEQDAVGLADDYDETHVGVGRVQISAV